MSAAFTESESDRIDELAQAEHTRLSFASDARSRALQLFEPQGMSVAITVRADELKALALSSSAMIAVVRDAHENEVAAAAQAQLKGLLAAVEKERKRVKEPFLDACATIDAQARAFVDEIKAEELRIAEIIGNWQQEQLEIRRAAEAARRTEEARIERERLAELQRIMAEERKAIAEAAVKAAAEAAAAKDTYDRGTAELKAAAEQQRIADEAKAAADASRARAEQEVLALAPPAPPVRAEGQQVRVRWVYELVDVWRFIKARPDLVKIEPLHAEVMQVINAGGVRDIPGLKIYEEVKATTRTPRGKVVDV